MIKTIWGILLGILGIAILFEGDNRMAILYFAAAVLMLEE